MHLLYIASYRCLKDLFKDVTYKKQRKKLRLWNCLWWTTPQAIQFSYIVNTQLIAWVAEKFAWTCSYTLSILFIVVSFNNLIKSRNHTKTPCKSGRPKWTKFLGPLVPVPMASGYGLTACKPHVRDIRNKTLWYQLK